MRCGWRWRSDVDVVSTDHRSWLRAEKRQADFTLIPGGLPSIEAASRRWFTIARVGGGQAQPGEVGGGLPFLRRA